MPTRSWPEKIGQAVPGAVPKAYADPKGRRRRRRDADAAYGTVPPELFARCEGTALDLCVQHRKSASRIGLGGAWFLGALVNSDVVVTGMHDRCNEHLSTHAVPFLLAFARHFEH
jgi:hypothetical protein